MNGGTEKKILDDVPSSREMAIADDGIYLVSSRDGTGSVISFYRFASGKVERTIRIDKAVREGLAISPDGRRLLFAERKPQAGDVMQIEGFR